jgi:hypothetical protein
VDSLTTKILSNFSPVNGLPEAHCFRFDFFQNQAVADSDWDTCFLVILDKANFLLNCRASPAGTIAAIVERRKPNCRLAI